jgi:hypothetical protein
MRTEPMADAWPALPVDEWQATRDTLQLWTQIVGKVRMMNGPLVNHWWNVPLYVTAPGLTTSLMSRPSGEAFQIDFDFQSHVARGRHRFRRTAVPRPPADARGPVLR